MTDAQVPVELTFDELLMMAQPVAAQESRNVTRKFGEYIEAADLQQEMLFWSLKHEHKLREWLEPNDDDPRGNRGRGKLHVTYRRLAVKIAHRAKAARLGYSVHDLHFYNKAMVEDILPRIFSYDDWTPESTSVGARGPSGKDPAVGGDLMALVVDVKGSYLSASQGDRDLMYALFIERPPRGEHDVAEELGVTTSAVRKRADRALGRMVERLGGVRPDFGSRRRSSLSNAESAFATEHPDSLPYELRLKLGY